MTSKPAPAVFGRGGQEMDMSPGELRQIVEQSLASVAPGARVLAIIPDKTRDDNTDLLFPFAARALASRGAACLDALVAQGTHAPMSESEKRLKIGAQDPRDAPGLGRLFDHRWDRTDELVTIGELSREHVRELTAGLLDQSIPLRVNRLLAPGLYDTVLIFGATVPHEVAGFSGGGKYFFPGVAGPELTHATHWLGALATVEGVIGRVETPTRHLIEAAADFVAAQVISFTSVVTRAGGDRLRTHALFAGDFRQSLRRAASVSRMVHIKYTGRKYARVVALLDEHYEDLWVGGKASYKLGGIIEDGGELLIYAPHLRQISETHGRLIERYGYAPLESVRELVEGSPELQANLAVAAHLTHVAYGGRRDEGGRVVPRFRITLASGLDEATCRRIRLGFMDHRRFRLRDYEDDPDTLIVERAGRDLYLVTPEKYE
jgi:nickel-dependent lactate racemase